MNADYDGNSLSLALGSFALKVVAAITAVVISYPLLRNATTGILTKGVSVISDYRLRVGVKEKTKDETKTEVKMTYTPVSGDTPIYRWGKHTDNNLTPKEKDIDGLSFSTIPKKDSVVTTIDIINSTNILCATQNGPTHVSVVPCNTSVQAWIEAGPSSIWTKTMMNISFKWYGN